MSVSSDILPVSVTQCLDAIKQAFHDGGAIIEKIKRKRALKRAPPPPRVLEESIDQAPHEIEKERQRGLDSFGKDFEDGDHLAVITLQAICIQLQSSLLEKLRNTAFDDDHATTDFTYLVDAADLGRDRTIAALHEFKQRLMDTQSTKAEPQSTNGGLLSRSNTYQASQPSTSPNSSKSNITTPPSEPQRRETSQALSVSDQSKAAVSVRQQRTWSRDFSVNGDNSAENTDTISGAEEAPSINQAHHRKRSSLLHFLKHTRTHSSDAKDTRQQSALALPVVEEPARQRSLTLGNDARPAPTSKLSHEEKPEQQQPTKSRYEEWEDDPAGIWRSKKPSLDRRETVALAPDQQRDNAQVHSGHGVGSLNPPASPVLTHRSNSNPHTSSVAIPIPNPENEFLGFCKGAWKLQNGDRKGSLTKKSEVDPWSRHPSANAAQYLSCVQPRCAFRSSFSNPNCDLIWSKVFVFEAKGIKLRWPFLGKSHVQQKVVVKHQYSFKCLFCVFINGQSGVYHGMDYYLEHIVNEHRGRQLGDVVLYKAGCINDRIADDKEDFDINLYPKHDDVDATRARRQTEYLDDGLMDPHWAKNDEKDSMFGANEPWNEGLSDFHYRADEKYGVELE